MAGTLQDLNVAISRSKEKLIILGNFDMMLNGWSVLLHLAVGIFKKAQL
jgi:superfamily I DNA and/or RNA helicase